ncbi:Glutathione S-transferase-like protein tpcF [Pseudocercospora fuligena]|uniref:Glutathione S-transferase-like protein tpcF n=1 Tax=Pseudocercospora fuligena TaxID=685502 RepID=A0A8H6R702_9PEZI|nr:Glutathione S-transferase-like protein tpcF [Pseudocercospora fuligena]
MILIILEELQIPYELEEIPFAEIKQEPYISLNPNGRVPTIEDPNTGITLWESGAIIEYLVETYDKGKTLQYTSSPEKYLQSQWSYFQTSGQGPYFGQLGWFSIYHPEKIPSVLDRYKGEVRRVLGVIDAHLTKTGQDYLVGEKLSYVDLMFVPWHEIAPKLLMGEGFLDEWEKTWPKTWDWHQKLMAREGVQRTQALRESK